MKKIILCIAVLLAGCNPGKWHLGGTDIFTLIDISDPHNLKPDFPLVRDLYGMRSNACKSACFNLSYIGDMQYMPEYEYNLENRPDGESNNRYDDPNYRKKRIISFFTNIRDAITQANSYASEEAGRGNSECYRTIAKALTVLSERQSRKKYLLVYSDLTENSSIFSGYRDIEGEVVDNHHAVEYIRKRFEKEDLIPDKLNGITVYLIYEPSTVTADKKFSVFSSAYVELLQSRGAIVFVKSTNHFQHENNE